MQKKEKEKKKNTAKLEFLYSDFFTDQNNNI